MNTGLEWMRRVGPKRLRVRVLVLTLGWKRAWPGAVCLAGALAGTDSSIWPLWVELKAEVWLFPFFLSLSFFL